MSFSRIRRLLEPDRARPSHLIPRWLFLRALALIYFSAFYSLLFQIHGLIGPDGLLPARDYLRAVAQTAGRLRFWFAPTLLWWNSGSTALTVLCWAGLIASVLLFFNLWPRATLTICFLAFLSFTAAAQDFAGYQSDGMLLSAGFLAWFFTARGVRPGMGEERPPSRAGLFLLQWLWFRIYFESGVAKMASGDPEWRHLTAMDQYYQNGPLSTWIGWYAQHLPHWFQVGTAGATLLLELLLVWMLFLPRRFRLICFFIVTPWEIGVILTANYAFLNYLVLALGVLLLDDEFFFAILPKKMTEKIRARLEKWSAVEEPERAPELISLFHSGEPVNEDEGLKPAAKNVGAEEKPGEIDATKLPEMNAAAPRTAVASGVADRRAWPNRMLSGWRRQRPRWLAVKLSLTGIVLGWIFYATTATLLSNLVPVVPLPMAPVVALEPFRIAEQFGLFAVMTRARYEIEFQGSYDGQTWTAYPFWYKAQDPSQAPGIYAPYQPRFDWNLWFASLGSWHDYPFVMSAEERLLENDRFVLSLFAGNPFANRSPNIVRAVLWQYWFTSLPEHRQNGLWWNRKFLGVFAPPMEREPNGKFVIIEPPESPGSNSSK